MRRNPPGSKVRAGKHPPISIKSPIEKKMSVARLRFGLEKFFQKILFRRAARKRGIEPREVHKLNSLLAHGGGRDA